MPLLHPSRTRQLTRSRVIRSGNFWEFLNVDSRRREAEKEDEAADDVEEGADGNRKVGSGNRARR